jgi:CBS domain containing-hemolysin-like protein
MCSFCKFICNFKPYAPIAVGVVVVILTFLSGVGKLLPKRIGLNHPEAIKKLCGHAYENRFYHHSAFYMVIDIQQSSC